MGSPSCSSDSKKSSASPVEASAFCAEWADARCAGIQGCCSRAEGKYPNEEACQLGERTLCDATLLPGITDPQYGYDPAAAGAIVARLRSASRACREASGSIELGEILSPALAPGSACDLANAFGVNPCRGSFCLPSNAGSTQGICALLPGEGEPCPDLVCAEGLGCTGMSSLSRCVRLPAAGEGCSSSSDLCAPGLACLPTRAALEAFFSGSGTLDERECSALRPNGSRALEPDECASGMVRVGAADVRCSACDAHADCLTNEDATALVTVSIDNYTGYCESGVCRSGEDAPPRSKPIGARCFTDAECRSLRCERVPSQIGTCAVADPDALFCTSPVPGGSGGASGSGGAGAISGSAGRGGTSGSAGRGGTSGTSGTGGAGRSGAGGMSGGGSAGRAGGGTSGTAGANGGASSGMSGMAGTAGAGTGDSCDAGYVEVGQFATHCGLVNVHTDGAGGWARDDDCRSGCNITNLGYCQKFWPSAEIVLRRSSPSSDVKVFWDANCNLSYMGTGEMQYLCCAPE